MKKILKEYLKIITETIEDENIKNSSSSNFIKPRFQRFIFETFKDNIIKEYVNDPTLIPIPTELYDYILNKFKQNNFLKISYDKLAELCEQFNYEYSYLFKESIKDFAKGRYLLIYYCSVSELPKNLKIQNTVTGLTIYEKRLDIDKFDPCVIFLNSKNLKLQEDISDTLEHELTHFIQHGVGLEITTKNLNFFEKQNLRPELFELSQKMTNNITDPNEKLFLMKSICEKFQYILSQKEIIQTIKKVLNGFQRIYERSSITNKNWLNHKLNELNNLNYFNNQSWIELLKNIYYSENQEITEYKKTYECWIYLGYFALKTINYSIDKKLQEHFLNIIK